MLVTWSLFVMWIVFNLVDVAISWWGAQFGTDEVELLWRISSNWWSMAMSKTLLALLIGGLLVYARKDDWLALLTLGMAGLCTYNGWVFLQQVAG